ncbi:hypothetical protein QR680_006544 [Steinernema hermaphroditum]|uniref:Peptidase M14 domain-containing protein n=1 Tax=Steinernema hermaphroditum TaxID=289476 RepID=A0AA39HVS8_9BILA|nr:hypothetical protein QR680_006544 [Steinernema hermaphroditum]
MALLFLWLCLLLPATSVSLKEERSDYKIYRLITANLPQHEALVQAFYDKSLGVHFIKGPPRYGRTSDVKVSAKHLEEVEEFLDEQNIDYIQMFPNDGQTVDETVGTPTHCVFYRMGKYCQYNSMLRFIRQMTQRFPLLTESFTIGHSHKGRPLTGIRIGAASHIRHAVVIDAGIHAREWPASHAAMFFIEKLLHGYGTDPQITEILDNLDIHIIPLLNPDGYEYSRSANFKDVRMWRGNRGMRVMVNGSDCSGVDVNRNFDFHWGETGSSSDPCALNYGGPEAFSESGSKALREFILSPPLKGIVDAYVTIHSFGGLVIMPYNIANESLPEDHDELKAIGEKVVAAASKFSSEPFKLGTSVSLLNYSASGSSVDWAQQTANVKYSYCIELMPTIGSPSLEGFQPPEEKLWNIAASGWEGLKVIMQAALELQKKTL